MVLGGNCVNTVAAETTPSFPSLLHADGFCMAMHCEILTSTITGSEIRNPPGQFHVEYLTIVVDCTSMYWS